jgi:hypothetical protein
MTRELVAPESPPQLAPAPAGTVVRSFPPQLTTHQAITPPKLLLSKARSRGDDRRRSERFVHAARSVPRAA